MQTVYKTVNGQTLPVLEITILDEEELRALPRRDVPALQLELDALNCLHYLQGVTTLILTGGMATEEGMTMLYDQLQLRQLVLDYEETDSDEDGIDLSQFPALCYVLTRSNLNIRPTSPTNPRCQVEICNFYRCGKPVKIPRDSCCELLVVPGQALVKEQPFLFLSAEAKSPAGPLLMDLLRPLNQTFSIHYRGVRFSEHLDQITIVALCFPRESASSVRQRRYVSLHRRFADLRLHLPYEALPGSTAAQRSVLCLSLIEQAACYLAAKDPSFQKSAFLQAIKGCLPECNA